MKKNTVKIMALAGILCLASVGGVSAYLTDYEKVPEVLHCDSILHVKVHYRNAQLLLYL